ncbi:MAG TPA: helix-turn-helix domain-containing protein [Terriglobales bacterium]|nr:helix-turn-helix domain-containing protein [Terriglobales bacterium]
MGTFGQRLKREREMRGIGLEEIASATKIGIRMLRALEDERFDLLPGGIFNKGFVRAYAKHVGIDEEQAVADFLVATGETPVSAPVEPQPAARPVPEASRWVIAAALVVVLALAAFVVWRWNSARLPEPAGSSLSNGAVARPEPASAPVASPTTAATAPTSVAAAPEEVTQAEPFTLRIHALRECWVLAVADGQREEWTLPADSERVIRAHQSIVLKVGNAGGVELAFNEQMLEPLGAENETRTLTFTAQGARPGPPEPLEAQPLRSE